MLLFFAAMVALNLNLFKVHVKGLVNSCASQRSVGNGSEQAVLAGHWPHT